MATNSSNMIIESGMTLHKMLANNGSIEIPIIQRDYAQGRKNCEEIRDDFLGDIFSHLSCDKPMKLSFVYGTQNETQNGSIFVPYDGQQRLTLLYLLTMFLAAYCKDWDTIKILSRFRYFTRDYATDFCRFLTGFDTGFDDDHKNVYQRIDVFNKTKISESIKNDSAFFGSWIYEPTVASMVAVLQSIQEEFESVTKRKELEEKCETARRFLREIEDGRLFFDWCSIQASDNIYIKMNGRGKPLSAFDNFKNTLYGELDKLRKRALTEGKNEELQFIKNFEEKMDGPWTDFFWKKRDCFSDKENYEIAPYMMNFFFFLFELRHAISSETFFFGGKESFRWIDEKNVISFLLKFKDVCNGSAGNQISITDYVWISKLLDVIVYRFSKPIDTSLRIENYPDEMQLIKELSSHKGGLGSSRTIIVSAIYFSYLVEATQFDNDGNLIRIDDSCREQWVEMIGRLLKTASKFEGRYDALLRDKHVLKGLYNIFVPLAFDKNPSGDFNVSANSFDQSVLKSIQPYFNSSHVYSQLVDELYKYYLRSNNAAVWDKLLQEAEKELPYFENMILFLIAVSRDKNGTVDPAEFKNYLDTAKSVVGDKGIKNENHFSAILLSIADYRISSEQGYSNSWSLCSNTSDECFNWRYFFDVLEGTIKESNISKIDVIKSAFDVIRAHNNDVVSAYNSITKNPNDPSWRSVVIRFPEILDAGSKHRIIYSDESNWFIIKSEGVVKQVHANSLPDSYNIELYGLYRTTSNSKKLQFEPGMILIDKDSCITKKENCYIIHDKRNDIICNYYDALNYLNAL